jgi:hypothetical protein
MGVTINVGNYESIKYNIGIELPCSKKDIAKTEKYLNDHIKKAIQKKTKEFREIGQI